MWQPGCSWWCSAKWDLCKYCTCSTPIVSDHFCTCQEAFCYLLPNPLCRTYSSRDVLSSTKPAKHQGAAPACSSSGLNTGSRAGPRDHNTPGSFPGDSAAGPHHHHCTCSHTGTFLTLFSKHRLLLLCKAPNYVAGSMIWSSAFWTKEKCLQRNCI